MDGEFAARLLRLSGKAVGSATSNTFRSCRTLTPFAAYLGPAISMRARNNNVPQLRVGERDGHTDRIVRRLAPLSLALLSAWNAGDPSRGPNC